MNFYKYIDFYPQKRGMSFQFSFNNYDNKWTGLLNFISSGSDNLKLFIESGKIFNENKNFISPINMPYAGEIANNSNIFSGNLYQDSFNFFFNNTPIFASINKEYGSFSGIEFSHNNELFDVYKPNLKLAAKSFPRYSLIYGKTGDFGNKTIPVTISGHIGNEYPIKFYSINLGREEGVLSELTKFYFVTGINASRENPLVIPPGGTYNFEIIKTSEDIPLNDSIPFFFNTSFGEYIRFVEYEDVLPEIFPQESSLDAKLFLKPKSNVNIYNEFVAKLYLGVYNTTSTTSGFYVYISGADGNNVCDYTLCDRFYPNWSFFVNDAAGLWQTKQSDFYFISNFQGQQLQKDNLSFASKLYTGTGIDTGNGIVSNIFISKNIKTPNFYTYRNVTGFGLILYNSGASTGADIDISIYPSRNWSGTYGGYNTGFGPLIPNTGQLLYREKINVELTEGPTYYPIKLTGTFVLSGNTNYSIVFNATTTSGAILWPKNAENDLDTTGTPYSSFVGYSYNNTVISHDSQKITSSYNSYVPYTYNHAFEINPPTTFPDVMYGWVPVKPKTDNQLFTIEIQKRLINDDFTGSAFFTITGDNIFRTGIVGITKNVYREYYGFYN